MTAIDVLRGVLLGIKTSRSWVIHSFAKVPAGIVTLWVALYGVNSVILVTGVHVPASVVCLVLLFVGLLVMERILGTKKVSWVLKILDIPMQFSLRWMNMYFVTPFLLLPLSPPVSRTETGKIAAVFILGYLVMFVSVAYTVVGLQKLTHTTRRAHEEPPVVSNNDQQVVSTTTIELIPQSRESISTDSIRDFDDTSDDMSSISHQSVSSVSNLLSPPRAAAVSLHTHPSLAIPQRCLIGDPVRSGPQDARLQSRSLEPTVVQETERVAAWVAGHPGLLLYGIVAVAGSVLYYTIGVSVLLHISVVVLSFRAALLVKQPYRVVIHPILLCCSLSLLFFFVFARLRGDSIYVALNSFSTGRTYLTLFDKQYYGVVPGAGDVLSSLLDVSIVSLALPMYQYRLDLRRHFLILISCSIGCALVSFFAYPPLCYAIGIAPTRSLAFTARSVTLALAMPIVDALDGSTALVSVVAILSGIIGVIIGGFLLGPKVLRIRQDDYVTRGITMGINSSAVASVHLLQIDPRASALASLSLFLFGLVEIFLAAVPPVANLLRSWVGL